MSTVDRNRAPVTKPTQSLPVASGVVRRDLPSGRRVGQWAAAVLVVVVTATLAAWLYLQKGDTVEVLVVQEPVPAGAVIQTADLSTAQVSGVTGAFDVADVDVVVGMRAAAGLVAGQVLTEQAVTDATVPAEGERLVALRLDAGRVPVGLLAGEVIDVLAVPAEGEVDAQAIEAPAVLAEAAQVSAVTEAVDGGFIVSVLTAESEARRLAAYAAGGRVTIVQAPLGGVE